MADEKKIKVPPSKSTAGTAAAAGAGQGAQNPPLPVQAAVEEFIAIKKALSTPEPPWVLAQGLNAKLKLLFPPPNACLVEPPVPVS
jgi:hypothetical protein